MNEKQVKQITEETYQFLANKGVGFICYVWDREEGNFAGGCRSADADMGDAMVAIARIITRFNIDPDRLFIALQEVKLEMEKD